MSNFAIAGIDAGCAAIVIFDHLPLAMGRNLNTDLTARGSMLRVYLQEACLRHQFIRSKDTANLFHSAFAPSTRPSALGGACDPSLRLLASSFPHLAHTRGRQPTTTLN